MGRLWNKFRTWYRRRGGARGLIQDAGRFVDGAQQVVNVAQQNQNLVPQRFRQGFNNVVNHAQQGINYGRRGLQFANNAVQRFQH